jgi:succinylglutamic semialdehyde dehydrogenase
VVKTRALEGVARGRYTHGRFTLPDDIGEEFELRSPATREVLGVFPCGAGDVDDAVGSAAGAQLRWEGLALEVRLQMLSRIEPVVLERGDELAAMMQRELGRPGWECRRELDSLIPRMHDLFALARKQIGEVAQGAARIRHRAHGVVALVSPVMLPLATAHTHLLSALVTGNTVVWKPSSLTAGSAQLYTEVLHAAGLPAGVVNLVQGRASVGRRLLAHPGIDGAVFIGSREHAREVRRELGARLELATVVHAGARNAAIVLDGTELDRAASEIATCAFLSSGQRSTALGRVLVQAALRKPLLEALVAHTRRLAATPRFAGPLVSAERHDRHFARLRAAESAGASVIVRPESRPDSLFAGPSIHLVEDRACAVDYLRDELFGPDLAIEPVADLADALARLHGHDMLIASLFAAAQDDRVRFEDEASAGALFWNHAPSAISGWLSFAAKGGPERGPTGLLAMARRVACIGAASALATPLLMEEVECPTHAMTERRVS